MYLKLEGDNPAGSIKDRAAMNMLNAAEKSNLLSKNKKIVEPTSGNTGIALAMACAIKGYELILVMPENMSIERRAAMYAYGAEIILVSTDEGMEGARDKALEIAKEQDAFFLINLQILQIQKFTIILLGQKYGMTLKEKLLTL